MQIIILRRPQMTAVTGLARSTIYNYVQKGLLPKPVKIGLGSIGWPQYEVDEINAARIAGLNDDEIRDLVAKLEAARKIPHHRKTTVSS